MAKSRLRKIAECVMAQADFNSFAGISWDTGRLAVKENQDAPRVVWIGPAASHSDAQNIGGRRIATGEASRRDNSVKTRVLNVEIHCWGYDINDEKNQDAHYAVAEDLVHAVISAVWRLYRGMATFNGDAFPTQSPGADYAQRGEKAIVSIGFELPVIAEEKTPIVVLNQSHTTTFVSDLDENKTEVVC